VPPWESAPKPATLGSQTKPRGAARASQAKARAQPPWTTGGSPQGAGAALHHRPDHRPGGRIHPSTGPRREDLPLPPPLQSQSQMRAQTCPLRPPAVVPRAHRLTPPKLSRADAQERGGGGDWIARQGRTDLPLIRLRHPATVPNCLFCREPASPTTPATVPPSRAPTRPPQCMKRSPQPRLIFDAQRYVPCVAPPSATGGVEHG
jgi:hypothetical protein